MALLHRDKNRLGAVSIGVFSVFTVNCRLHVSTVLSCLVFIAVLCYAHYGYLAVRCLSASIFFNKTLYRVCKDRLNAQVSVDLELRSTITGCAAAQHCYNGDVSFLWENGNFEPM